MFFRMDYIHAVELLDIEPDHVRYAGYFEKFQSHLWGTSGGTGFNVDHLEMTVYYGPNVEILDDHTCRYTTDVYDASELIPWLRTFIGRIVKLECSDNTVVERFWSDLEKMSALYGGDA